MDLKEIRAKYPMYDDMSDDQFARAFHQKHYSDLEFKDFSKRVGYLKGANPAEYDPASTEFKEGYGATSGMSTLDRIRAGWGGSVLDMGRGIGQAVEAMGRLRAGVGQNEATRQAVAETRATNEDLYSTGAGKVGRIGGTIATAIPTAFIPGANTYAGTAAIGAGLGAAQPSVSGKETLTNAAVGGVLSPLAMLAGRGLVAGAKGVKAAVVDPFTKAGQERIAANTLRTMAGGADDAARAAENIRTGMQDVLPGVKPTTAELAQNAGLSNLERILKNNPEYTTAFADRAATNRNAITTAMEGIAGDDLARSAAVQARSSAAAPWYEAADVTLATSDDELTKLLARPSMEKALERAAQIADESGEEFSTDILTGKNLHVLKMAMDDIADNPAASGIGGNEARAIKGTRDALLSWIERKIPAYGVARETFKEGSKPINQMDIGQVLKDKLLPAMTDYGAQTRLRPESFAQALRNGDATAANVMGRSQASITDILSPEQMKTLTQVGQQLGRRVNADELGKAVGSNTGQNLVGQNVMRQLLGPLGLPDKWSARVAAGPLAQGVMGAPAKIAEKVTGTIGEPNVLKKLVEIGLTPEEAIRILSQQINAGPGLLRYQGATAPVVSGAYAAGK